MRVRLKIVKVNRQPCARAALNIPRLPAHSAALLAKSASIALYRGDALDSYSLRRVHQVLQSTRSRVTKAQVPRLCICSLRFPFGPGVELVSPGEEGLLRVLLWKVFQHKLVVSLMYRAENLISVGMSDGVVPGLVSHQNPLASSFLRETRLHAKFSQYAAP